MKLHLLSTTLLATLLATGCGKKGVPADQPFIYARAADTQKLDPAVAGDNQSAKVLNNICEGLVRFKNASTDIEPCLAETWSFSSDGRTCIFALRDGVKFHDGTALDAAAVVWNFNRQMGDRAPGTFPDVGPAFFGDIEAVRVLDTQRLEIRLKKPNVALLPNLATVSAALISPRSLADYGEGMQRRPVGTGPYKLREWLPNERIVLEANPEYWGQKPKRDRVIFTVVPNSSARFLQLQTGQVHAMDGLDPNDLDPVRADKSLTLLEAPGINLAYLAFNCRKPPMDKLEFREAVAMAVQKPRLIQTVYRGAALAAHSPLPPALRPADAKPEERTLDLDRARNLIAQLQIVLKPITVSTNDAFGLPLTYTTNIIERVELPLLRLHVMAKPQSYLPNPTQAAELIKADLEAIGLRIQIVAQDPAAFLVTTRNGEHDLALAGHASRNGDAGSFLDILDPHAARAGNTANICFLDDFQLAAALTEGREQLDPVKRAAIHARVLALAHERLPILPLAHAYDTVALRQNVHGFTLQPTLDVRLAPVKLK